MSNFYKNLGEKRDHQRSKKVEVITVNGDDGLKKISPPEGWEIESIQPLGTVNVTYQQEFTLPKDKLVSTILIVYKQS